MNAYAVCICYACTRNRKQQQKTTAFTSVGEREREREGGGKNRISLNKIVGCVLSVVFYSSLFVHVAHADVSADAALVVFCGGHSCLFVSVLQRLLRWLAVGGYYLLAALCECVRVKHRETAILAAIRRHFLAKDDRTLF